MISASQANGLLDFCPEYFRGFVAYIAPTTPMAVVPAISPTLSSSDLFSLEYFVISHRCIVGKSR